MIYGRKTRTTVLCTDVDRNLPIDCDIRMNHVLLVNQPLIVDALFFDIVVIELTVKRTHLTVLYDSREKNIDEQRFCRSTAIISVSRWILIE
jgi:hypothetical protein